MPVRNLVRELRPQGSRAPIYSVHASRYLPRLAGSPTLDFLLEPELLGRSTVALALGPLAKPASTAASPSSCCVSALAILDGVASLESMAGRLRRPHLQMLPCRARH